MKSLSQKEPSVHCQACDRKQQASSANEKAENNNNNAIGTVEKR